MITIILTNWPTENPIKRKKIIILKTYSISNNNNSNNNYKLNNNYKAKLDY